MTFEISKCATLVVKLNNFIPSRHYENSTFNLRMNNLPIKIDIMEYILMNH